MFIRRICSAKLVSISVISIRQSIPTENLQIGYDFLCIFHNSLTPCPKRFSPYFLVFIFSPSDVLFHLVGIPLLITLKQCPLIIFPAADLQVLECLVQRTFCYLSSDTLSLSFFTQHKIICLDSVNQTVHVCLV